MKLAQLNTASQLITQSPIRLNNSLNDLIGFDRELTTIGKRLKKIEEKLQTTLKVFLIGEVKAGKSTLINALVGQEISPTNVLEATSCIWEIGYAEQTLTTIVFKDGTSKAVDYEEIISYFGTEQEHLTLASTIEKITVKTDNHQFKELLLIDSPGLATLTSQNAEVTKNIMQEIDLALWIFNANHLGQSDILDEVATLAQLGKPIIAVINKIDEVEESPEKLIRYLNRTSGEYFKEIFAISAYQASITTNDNQEFEEYFDELKNYLIQQVSLKATEVKNESLQSTFNSLMNSEKTLHESAIKKLQKLQQEHQNFSEDLLYEKRRLSDDILIMIEQKCNDLNHDYQFTSEIKKELEDDRSLVQKAMNPLSSLVNVAGSKNTILTKVLENKGNPIDNIAQSHLERLSDEIYAHYKIRFIDVVKTANNKSIIRMEDFNQQEQLRVSSAMRFHGLATQEIELTQPLETASTATIVSAAGGVAAAGYAAVLGSSAATVTMGAALATIALPVTIVGGIGGLAYGWWKSKDNRSKLDAQITQTQTQISEKIQKLLFNTFSKRIENDFELVEKENKYALFKGMDKHQLRDYLNQIDEYIIKLNIENTNDIQLDNYS